MQTTLPPARKQGELGFWMATALVIGNTIGMGVFLLPASLAPLGLNALVGWFITVVGCLVVAQVFARFSSRFPDSDGPYGYVKSHLGERTAFLIIWCYWISMWATNAALATGVVGYLGALVPAFAAVPNWLMALLLVWIFVGINLLGARTGGEVQVLTTALKLLPMLVVVGLGVWVLFSDPGAYTRTIPSTPISLTGATGIMAACTTVLYSMLGIESATVPAGQVRDPERTIPRATMVGTILVSVIYIVVSTVPILLIPQAELGASDAPFVDLLDRLLGVGPGRLLAAFVVISGIGALNGWTLLTGDLTRTMAHNGVLPAPLGRSNGRGAPGIALVATGFLASGLVAISASDRLAGSFRFLTDVVGVVALPLYFGCSLALIVVWSRRLRPAASSLAVLGGIGAAYSAFAFAGAGKDPFLVALGLAAAGIPVYLVMRWVKTPA